MFRTVKKLASFRNRNKICGSTVEQMAYKIYSQMSSEFSRKDVKDSKLCSILEAMTGVQSRNLKSKVPSTGKMWQCIQKYLEICTQDHQDSDVHKCTRNECKTYCILPMYTRRCMSNESVNELFDKLKDIMDEYPSSMDYLSESKIAVNLLIHIASSGNNSLKESYDVLYAMAGHRGIIFNPESNVDSKLYELLLDLFTDYENRSLHPASLTLMSMYDSRSLAANIERLENERENLENLETSLLLPSTETTPPPVPRTEISVSETLDLCHIHTDRDRYRDQIEHVIPCRNVDSSLGQGQGPEPTCTAPSSLPVQYEYTNKRKYPNTRISDNPRIDACSSPRIPRSNPQCPPPSYDSLDFDGNPRRSCEVNSTQNGSNFGLPSYEEALTTLSQLADETSYV